MEALIRKIFAHLRTRDALVFLTLIIRGELTEEDIPLEMRDYFWPVSTSTMEFRSPHEEEEAIDALLTVMLEQNGSAPRAYIETRFPGEDLID
jgi:hypothetical protein